MLVRKKAFSRAEIRDKIVKKIKILLQFFFRNCKNSAGNPNLFELKEKSYKSSSLLPGKIGVRNASETTTELLKYPELPGPLSGP